MDDKTQFLQDQLTKEPGDSKKWRMAKNGLWGVAVFFGVGIAAAVFLPAVAAQVVILVQTAIGAWTAICGVYLGAQGSVDFKTTQALSNTIEKRDETRTEYITITQEELDADSDIPREEVR